VGGDRRRVIGNQRLTAATAVLLLILLAAEGATIPFIGQLVGPHIFIGVLLIPPVLLKLGSTGYRFVRYYARDRDFRAKGPPPAFLRWTAPATVALTLLLLVTGAVLLFDGRGSGQLVEIHKVTFIVWVAFMGLHVLGHLRGSPSLAAADWRRSAPQAAVSGATARIALVGCTLIAGAALGYASLLLAASWL